MIRTIRIIAAAATVAATLGATAGVAAAGPDRPGVVRDGNLWQLRDALSGGSPSVQFRYGNPDDPYRVTGDWDGNGSRTPGVVRFSGNHLVWYLRNSNSAGGAYSVFEYGSPGDTPVVGDWDGDGRDTVGVLRPQDPGFSPWWLLRNENTAGGATVRFVWGSPRGFVPVPGDWDGNGTDTPGEVIYPGDGIGQLRWLTRDTNDGGGANRDFSYGSSSDTPVVGDWDGDGADGIGVYKAQGSQLLWRLRQTPTYGQPQYTFTYGPSTERVFGVTWAS